MSDERAGPVGSARAADGAAAGSVVTAALRLFRRSAETAAGLLPRDEGAPWRELRNKLEAFELFQQAPSLLGVTPGERPRLAALLARAAALGSYRGLWVTEGLGHAYAESAWRRAGPPRRLLSRSGLADLPTRSLVPLHTGMGLAFAGRQLAAAAGGLSLSRALSDFVDLCRDNSREGYAEAALEAVGLAARNLYPHLLRALDGELAALDPRLMDLFWHGVGRGLYFAPTNSLPVGGGAAVALEQAYRDPPHRLGRRNAVAGWAWALTLVNIRHPEVVAALLVRAGDRLGANADFADGAGSALAVWLAATGDEAAVDAFLDHRPTAAAAAALWQRQVRLPCGEALRRRRPLVERAAGLGELFRCRTPEPARERSR